MIKQFLTVAAIVGMMSGTAFAQGAGGSQNPNQSPPTAGGVGPSGQDQAPVYRDAQGNPCSAGSAGCSRTDGKMKTQ